MPVVVGSRNCGLWDLVLEKKALLGGIGRAGPFATAAGLITADFKASRFRGTLLVNPEPFCLGYLLGCVV